MVRILTGMRTAALANARHTAFGIVSIVGAALLGLVAAAATLLLGFTAPLSGGADQLALLLLTWVAGRVGFAAFSGADPAMPLDLFRTLPLPRRALSRAILTVGFADPSLFFLGIAACSLVAFGFRQGVGPGLVGIAGAALLLVLVSVLSTIVSALVPAGSRRRQDAGTLLAAVLISAVFVTGTLASTILSALAAGDAPALTAVLRILPSGWAPDAVALAGSGSAIGDLGAAGLLLALVVACAGVAAWWPRVLGGRLESVGGSGRRHRRHAGRRILPATPVGAVASRELRLWLRDPTRSGFLLIAFVVGLGVCLVPIISHGAAVMLPFSGLGTIVIAAAIAGNSYGFDGPAIGLVLTTPGAERADVRGRQLAWLLLIGPYAVLLSVVGLLIAGTAVEWIWVLSLLPVALGSAAGVSVLASAIAPQPLDDGGGPTPAWTLKAYASLILTALATAPVVVLLILGADSPAGWMRWLGLIVGLVIGVACAAGLGAVAARRVARRGPEMLQALATATAGRR